MAETSLRAHWEEVYTCEDETGVSWFQDNAAPSLELIEQALGARDTLIGGSDIRIIDIGGGASRLADGLLERGFRDLSVLDISAAALDLAALRLGRRASEVQWITADVTEWQPSRRFDVWHDRAVFHFLVDPADRAAYVTRLGCALVPGGHAIIATFAAGGPDTCSGLPVCRYDAPSLAAELGAEFTLVESRPHDHVTPWNSSQRFQFSVFQKQSG